VTVIQAIVTFNSRSFVNLTKTDNQSIFEVKKEFKRDDLIYNLDLKYKKI